jgi:hypothetical protein
MWSERKVALVANEIYRKHKLGLISDSQALKTLYPLTPYMGSAQYFKHLDFCRMVKDNPNFYQRKV